MFRELIPLPIVVIYMCFASEAFIITDFNPNPCGAGKFSCRSKECIPVSERCNGRKDCSDGSDEKLCEMFLCKPPNFYRCWNDRCISSLFHCDGEDDCGDFSDEFDCKERESKSMENCTGAFWECSDKHCIPRIEVCDGVSNCPDHSDEMIGCSIKLTCDGFKCKNGHCIVKEWQCDGTDDCGDKSDEENCSPNWSLENCSLEYGKYLCKNQKSCVNLTEVCNGRNDCPDKSDEGRFCVVKSACQEFNCSNKCVLLPSGPHCICPPGFKEDPETKGCKDVNECDTYGICDQKCKNTEGSYECHCAANYKLQADKRSCKAEGGEALLIFAMMTEIRGYFLESNVYYPIVKNTKQAIGVAFDGHYIYWSDLFQGHESIVRSAEDGSNRELLVTAGLGTPEGIAVDWTTGNFYFVDSTYKHIAVCNHDGYDCAILLFSHVDKPRGIVLDSIRGQMYWTDWGNRPEIGRANMDGSEDISFVTNQIFWPNGLALDSPNERLYWTDAGHDMIQSIRLDGTDRRVILEDLVKHPYSVAVFEDRLYWSDWGTDSIETCNKFSGKNHSVVLTERHTKVFGMQVFHPALKEPSSGNKCNFASCSHLCLLTKEGYSCACPEDMTLGTDKLTCREVKRKEVLIVGVDHSLYRVRHQRLGKHMISKIPYEPKWIGCLAYNMINNSLLISDTQLKKIISYNLDKSIASVLPIGEVGYVNSMKFDYLGNNLYWCDTLRETIEVFNFNTMSRTVLIHDLAGDIPQSILLIPEDGIMFVAFTKHSAKKYPESHIDRFMMDGSGRAHTVDIVLTGPISLEYDSELRELFWADAGTHLIEKISIDGKNDRHTFRFLPSPPVGLTSLKRDIFWVYAGSRNLYWADKSQMNGMKRITIDESLEADKLFITSATPTSYPHHPCSTNNGNCSHLCLPSVKSYVCACPIGMLLDTNNRDCYVPKECNYEHFLCILSNACIPVAMRCNGRKDCSLGEDEMNCPEKNVCPTGMFQCKNKECIDEKLQCDNHNDCTDKSDELDCHSKSSISCKEFQFKCKNGKCLDYISRCDNYEDCADGEDEEGCLTNTCPPDTYRCLSGQCIPEGWECDARRDCTDGTDEHERCGHDVCPEFKCLNDNCISNVFRCDGNDDCGDMSDEYGCGNSNKGRNHTCSDNEFACNSALHGIRLCVPAAARCNGTSECPHHEDEHGCGTCHVDEFQCGNKWKCIPTSYICDGIDDCGDKSDEKRELCNVMSHKGDDVLKLEQCSDQFRCASGGCLDWQLVCDDKSDCEDGSDEGGACSITCQGTSNPCTQMCRKTPAGPKCYCNSGYTLRGDGRTCIDIEECEFDPPVCTQICFEKQGSYDCGCFDGFHKQNNTCKSAGEHWVVYYTAKNRIIRYSFVGDLQKPIYGIGPQRITGLDVDVRDQYLYFSVEGEGTISSLNLKTNKRRLVQQVGRPREIALDWISHHVYYVNIGSGNESTTIHVCNFDVKKCANLSRIEIRGEIGGIAVDAVLMYMFYAVNTHEPNAPPVATIYKANLDGSERTVLISSNDSKITALTYDINKHFIYYIDSHNNSIKYVTYNGLKKGTLFEDLDTPKGLNFFEDHLYFGSNFSNIMVCPLYVPKRACVSFAMPARSHFVIAQETRQSKGKNVCGANKCTFMCIPTRSGQNCICRDGTQVDDGEICPGDEEGGGSHPHFHDEQTEGDEDTNTVGIVLGTVIPIVCIAIGVIYYYYFPKGRAALGDIVTMSYRNLQNRLDPNSRAPEAPSEASETQPLKKQDSGETGSVPSTVSVPEFAPKPGPSKPPVEVHMG